MGHTSSCFAQLLGFFLGCYLKFILRDKCLFILFSYSIKYIYIYIYIYSKNNNNHFIRHAYFLFLNEFTSFINENFIPF